MTLLDRPRQVDEPVGLVRDLLARLGGRLSYRMFDYYCRNGVIQLEHGAVTGSGNSRVLTGPEQAAVTDLVNELAWIRSCQNRITSGEYFAERLAYHRSAEGRAAAHLNETLSA
jgi:hypothetical protein